MASKTSNAAKLRWIQQNYKRFTVSIEKADGEAFSALCKENGDTQSDVLRAAVYDYLGKPVPPSKARF